MQEYQIEAQKKAEVLVEALPYIQKFNRKIIVVKYGGSAMTDEALESNVIKDVTLLKLVGFKPIIVHGGGKAISSWVKKSGKEAKFVNGLRVTDAETMEIAEMVLGRLSKKLVTMVEQLGSKAVGISGKDGRLLEVKKDDDYLPIVAPIGLDGNFATYNINADEAACQIAKAVGADKLVYLTDVEGLYRDFNDKSSFISRISVDDADKLIADGLIGGGMLPKLSNCTDAVRGGVKRVHILDGRIPHSLLLEIFTDRGNGTMFYEDEKSLAE